MPPPAKIKNVENVFEELIKSIKAPVEFDLPSALKEWKIGYYKPIKRNVYLTKKSVEDDGIFCSCTPSSGSSVACDKDCQCGMLFSCCSSNCKCDNKCANKSFQHRSLAASLPFLSAARRRRSPAMPPPAKMKKVENVFEELIKSMKAPVEFDLPSALKEWKLGYYIPITRNVYLTKRRVEDDGIFCSCTPSSGSSVACDKYCQCGMLFSCCSSDCKCDNKCANKSFQHRPLKKTKLITTEKCGFGLVAEDEIKKGEFVIEYVGEVIDDRTCEERLWKMKRQRDTYSYLCEANSNMVIDATNKGNMSRFINHSCDPNTEMQKWTVDGETRVGIFALRDIKEGEELTYDYKFVQFGADQDCHCGSSNCRKMLGTTKSVNSIVLHNGNSGSSQVQHVVKKRKTTSDNCIGEIIRLWHRRDKMYVPAVIYGFNEYTKMHTLMFDVDITEEFDLREEDWDFLPRPEDPDE